MMKIINKYNNWIKIRIKIYKVYSKVQFKILIHIIDIKVKKD